MIITLGNMAECSMVPKDIMKKITTELTFNNPAYIDALKRGFKSHSIPPKILGFTQQNNTVLVPLGYIPFLLRFLRQKGRKFEIKSSIPTYPSIDVTPQGTPRPYQEKAIKAMLPYSHGILEAKTGAGKTFVGTHIIGHRKVPTLIVVHNKELLHQWKSAIEQFLGYQAGLIGDGKCEIKPISVGIVNSINTQLPKIKDKYCQLIGDEIHRVCGNTWQSVFTTMKCKYRLGLSATPYRRDGLNMLIQYLCGPIVHQIDPAELTKIGAVLVPQIIKRRTPFIFRYNDNYSDMVKALCVHPVRHDMIVEDVVADYRQHKEQLLVVSDRVSHCQMMCDSLKERGIVADVLAGSVSKRERESTLQRVKSGETQVLCSTTQLIGEGTDIPSLSGLFLTTPLKFKGRVAQTIGRVLRPSGNILPRIYDYVDHNVLVLMRSSAARDSVYRSMDWKQIIWR